MVNFFFNAIFNEFCSVGGVDVGQSVFMVVIPGDELSQCIAIELIDNKVALEGNRTYPVRITVIEPAGSGITIPDSTLTITENDSTFSVFLFPSSL